MPADIVTEKQQAHELVDRLPPAEVHSAVNYLQFLLTDRLSRKLATAPFDDEELTEEEQLGLKEAQAWLAQNGGRGIPHEEVLADFGLTMEDWEKMGKGEFVDGKKD